MSSIRNDRFRPAAKTLIAMPNMTKLLKETNGAGWSTSSLIPTDKRIVMVSMILAGSECLNRLYANTSSISDGKSIRTRTMTTTS